VVSSTNGELANDDPTAGHSNTPITAPQEVDMIDETKLVAVVLSQFVCCSLKWINLISRFLFSCISIIAFIYATLRNFISNLLEKALV